MKKSLFILCFLCCFLFSEQPIVLQIEKNLQEIGNQAFQIFKKELNFASSEGKRPVFILPTGSTPIPFYKKLVSSFFEGKLDLSKAIFFNMDEYVSLSPTDPNSYYYFMESYLYRYITPGMTLEKLTYFGLKPLTKKECSNNKKRERLNRALTEFTSLLLKRTQDDQNSLGVLQELVLELRSSNRTFKHLESVYMDDHILPSIEKLKSFIQHDISLQPYCPDPRNIHRMDGIALDLEKEVDSYKSALMFHLENPNDHVTCFGGIGVNPAHIAFNDFISESLFLNADLSEEEKNKKALSSSTRCTQLSEGTKLSNARFFNGDPSKVPSKALTIGLKETLLADRIVIMAAGSTKKNALYHTFSEQPSYRVPASLLRLYNQGTLTFLVDEKSYGLGEPHSLFSLNILKAKGSNELIIQGPSSNQMSFWDIPKQSSPALLYKEKVHLEDHLTYACIPKGKKVLWIKSGKLHYSLWNRFKDQQNEVDIIEDSDIVSLSKLIQEAKPDIVVLPYNQHYVQHLSKLSKILAKEFPGHPILGLFYDIEASYSNVHLPLKKSIVKKKARALKEYHQTQSKRTRFDLITREMSKAAHSPFNYTESFTFFKLKSHQGKIHRVAYPRDTLIQKKTKKNKSIFSFEKEDLVLSVSPHPDDTEIGLGALVHYLGKQEIPLVVFNATSGNRAFIQKKDILTHSHLPEEMIKKAAVMTSSSIENKSFKAKVRAFESQGALTYLNPNSTVCHLNLPFYETKSFTKEDRRLIDEALEKYVDNPSRLIVFLPHPSDQHATHLQTYQIFKERILHFVKKHPEQDVILAYYTTPWTGDWNLYDYSDHHGSKLSAITGAERLAGSGLTPTKFEVLGGSLARRYRLFYF